MILYGVYMNGGDIIVIDWRYLRVNTINTSIPLGLFLESHNIGTTFRRHYIVKLIARSVHVTVAVMRDNHQPLDLLTEKPRQKQL